MSIIFGNSTNINNNSYVTSTPSADVTSSRVVTNSVNLPSSGTLSGEVVAKDGNQITLKLSNNQTISARLEGSSDISVGNRMTFEIAKGGSNQTLLRPLFANLDANPAVNAALKAAGLPLTNTNIAMTTQMMNEGMSVNRNALFDMVKTVSSFPDANPATVVSLSNLDIPINETNINQFENYQNLQHQMVNDVISIADGLSQMVTDKASDMDMASSMKLAADVLSIVLDGAELEDASTKVLSEPQNIASESVLGANGEKSVITNDQATVINDANGNLTSVNGENSSANPAELNTVLSSKVDINSELPLNINSEQNASVSNETLTDSSEVSLNDNVFSEAKNSIITNLNSLLEAVGKNEVKDDASLNTILSNVKELIDEYNNDENAFNNIKVNSGNGERAVGNEALLVKGNEAQVLAEKSISGGIKNLFEGLVNSVKDETVVNEEQQNIKEEISGRQIFENKLNEIIKSDDFGKLLSDKIKDNLTLKPEDVAKKDKIEEFYEKVTRQTAKIAELMDNNGKAGSEVAKSADNISSNIKFMNDVNEFMNYVQLPLKMAGENAHGELYVYAKKKNLEESDGNFSALLHLDMEHLGPMDVHVAMREYTKVNTHFYLQNEELLDFIEEHIDELTKRLQEKGYNSTINVSQRGQDEKTPITSEFGKDDFIPDRAVSGGIKMCFDVRA